jgi:catechol 2,3-dioxygenase-like lactoylglutathione lyase family enzyme
MTFTRLACIACLAICFVPRWSAAQLAPPNEAGITTGHMHLVVRDVQASKAFFVGLGGAAVKLGQIEGVKFPGVVFLLRQGEPTGGSAGSIVDHLGFLVKDGPASVERFKALGTKMELNASGRGGFFYTPDGLRLEMPERPALATPIVFDQIHFFVHEPAAAGKTMADMEAWYARVFGAQPGQPGGNPATAYEAKILPGVNLRYSKNPTPVAATRGRALDHIGFEVSNLEAFCKKLEAAGIKFDMPYTKRPDLGIAIAFITDPWGTYIELTEGLDKL